MFNTPVPSPSGVCQAGTTPVMGCAVVPGGGGAWHRGSPDPRAVFVVIGGHASALGEATGAEGFGEGAGGGGGVDGPHAASIASRAPRDPSRARAHPALKKTR